jgi:hypothetical protein
VRSIAQCLSVATDRLSELAVARRGQASRREDAERFIEEVLCDDPELASYLRIEERELEAGELNSPLGLKRFLSASVQVRYMRLKDRTTAVRAERTQE